MPAGYDGIGNKTRKAWTMEPKQHAGRGSLGNKGGVSKSYVSRRAPPPPPKPQKKAAAGGRSRS